MTAIPNVLTVIGNITSDLELKALGDGTKVVNFSIASTPRVRDNDSGEFKDGKPVFYRCSAWRRDAENLAASAKKGDRVIAVVEAKPNSYTTKGGDDVTTIEFEVKEIAVSLAFSTAVTTKNGKSDAAPAAAAPAAQAQAAPAAAAPVAAAPVAAAPAADEDFS